MGESNLDSIIDRVVDKFTSEISTLSNNEVDYVLRELITRFDGWLERVTEAQAAVASGFNPDDDSDLIENVDRLNRA